jgi:hypothetical protein
LTTDVFTEVAGDDEEEMGALVDETDDVGLVVCWELAEKPGAEELDEDCCVVEDPRPSAR